MHLQAQEFDQQGKTALTQIPPNGTEHIPGSWLETTQTNTFSQFKNAKNLSDQGNVV